MTGIKDLFASERGVFCIVLVLAVSVLTALGHFTGEQWLDFAKWIAAFLVAGKTLTTAFEAFANRGAPSAGGTSGNPDARNA